MLSARPPPQVPRWRCLLSSAPHLSGQFGNLRALPRIHRRQDIAAPGAGLVQQPGQHLGMLDLHSLQIMRVQPEQRQDRRRDLRRLDRLAVRAVLHRSRRVDEDRNATVGGVVAAVLGDLAAGGVDDFG